MAAPDPFDAPSSALTATRVSLWVGLATGGGLGRFEPAPGTLGSVVMVPVVAALTALPGGLQLGVVLAFIGIAVVAADRAGPVLGRTDHPAIVIDEMAGMAVGGLVVDAVAWQLALLLLAFRIADTLKPWPARWCERRLPGGLGVVFDDVAAGLWAAAVVILAGAWA